MVKMGVGFALGFLFCLVIVLLLRRKTDGELIFDETGESEAPVIVHVGLDRILKKRFIRLRVKTIVQEKNSRQ